MYRLLTLLLMITVLGACSSTDNKEQEPAELVDFEHTLELEKHWSESVGSGQDKRYTLLLPSIAGDRIYATDTEGVVVSLDRFTGKRKWKIELEEEISAGVGYGGGLLLLGTYSGEVIALSEDDGKELWRAQVSSEILAPPQSNGKVVVAQTLDGKIFGINAENGEQKWLYDHPMPVLTLRGTGTPFLTSRSVYAGFANGKVVNLNARDGSLRWEARVSLAKGRTELERVIDVDGSPLVIGDLVYAANYQGQLVALARSNGRRIWGETISNFQNIGSGLGNVYVTTENGTVYAFQANNGRELWKNDQMLLRGVSSPQAFGRYLAVGDKDGYVHLLNQQDGEFATRVKVGGDGIRSPMVSDGDILYVYSNSGKLVAFKIKEEKKPEKKSRKINESDEKKSDKDEE